MPRLRIKHFLTAAVCLQVPLSFGEGLHGYLGGVSNEFNRDIGNVPGNRHWGELGIEYAKVKTQGEGSIGVEALVNDRSLIMYTVREAYLGWKFSKKNSLRFGRQVLDWAPVDSIWGFGKLNNRRNFNFFVPGQEGLIGVNFKHHVPQGFKLQLFASGLYVPETNPSLDINKSDKTITSRHPWADPPARTTPIEGKDTQIEYNVDYPNISDVIKRYSIGLNVGMESKHWVWDNFFMRKPENQISTKVEVALDVRAGVDVVKAFITPQVFYHDVFGSSLKYRNKDLEIYVSGIGVNPNTFPDGNTQAIEWTEIKTEKRREAYLGPGFSKINDLYGFGFNYVARLSPFDKDNDILAQYPRWNQAVNAFFLLNVSNKVKVSVDGKYDMLTTDRLVMLRADFNVTKWLQVNTGINMIGTPTDGKSYWSPFTNNDAVFAGLRYIF